MTNYNNLPPVPGRRARYRTVTIGWRHRQEGDDLIIEEDPEGKPIGVEYKVPLALTAKQLIGAVERVGQENLQRLANAGTMAATLELLGAVIGEDIILQIANDPTVTADQFAAFVTDLIEGLGLDAAVPPAEEPADPKV